MKRKIILNLAISLDGYIADENGGFAWIKGEDDKSHDTEKQWDFAKFVESVDIIVMGKLAFLDCPKETLESFKAHKIYVASNETLDTEHSNVEFFNGDLVSQIISLQKEEGKDIWLFGGAGLTDMFIKKNVIDEYIIGFIPLILGKGKRLFLKNNPTINLHLEELTISEGIVISRYIKTNK
jgi:dihydrofolate reductase